jgi:hypothetical protein
MYITNSCAKLEHLRGCNVTYNHTRMAHVSVKVYKINSLLITCEGTASYE